MGYKPQTSFLDQCQPQWYLQDRDEAGQAILLCDYLQERKRWGSTNYFLYGVFDHGWYEFQLKCWCVCYFFVKPKCQILLQGISDATSIVTYHAVTIKKSGNKVPWFSFTFKLVIKMVLDVLKWLKETSLYEKKENNYY